MKSVLLFLSLGLLFLFSCSSGQEKPETSMDSTQADSINIVNEQVAASDEITNSEVQEYLRSFIIDFNAAKVSLPSMIYRESMEYDGKTYAYYFKDGKLAYISMENAAEGGFQEILMVRKEDNGDVILKTSTDGGSSFTCIYKGVRSGYLVTIRNEPLITGITEPYVDDYSMEAGKLFKEIQTNESKFKKKEEGYEFDLERKTVDSDYGKIEISKGYCVSGELFEIGLTKIVAGNFMDPDLIKKIMGKWYPLYKNTNGYERHTLCGHETIIEVSDKEGKIVWVELGLQDAWQAAVINLKEKQNNSYEIELSSQGSILKWPIALDENQNILFIEDKSYTNYPDKYAILEKGEDCSEFD